LDEDFPTPNESRLASGAPGPAYWQQEVDYKISVELDEEARRLIGDETITYTNNSPHTLPYLWLQLDQNRFAADSFDNLTRTSSDNGRIAYYNIRRAGALEDLDGGYVITNVQLESGERLDHIISDTNMRIDLPEPLEPGQSVTVLKKKIRTETVFSLLPSGSRACIPIQTMKAGIIRPSSAAANLRWSLATMKSRLLYPQIISSLPQAFWTMKKMS